MRPLGRASLVFFHLLLAASARRFSTSHLPLVVAVDASPQSTTMSRPPSLSRWRRGEIEKDLLAAADLSPTFRRLVRLSPLKPSRTQRRQRWDLTPSFIDSSLWRSSGTSRGCRREGHRVIEAPKIAPSARIRVPKIALTAKFRNFEEMLEANSRSTVLVSFYAKWCGPCRLLKHELEEVKKVFADDEKSDSKDGGGASTAAERKFMDIRKVVLEGRLGGGKKKVTREKGEDEASGGLKVFHVDAERFPQVAAKNDAKGLPTMVLFHNGTEVWRSEGLLRADDIVKVIRPFVVLKDAKDEKKESLKG